MIGNISKCVQFSTLIEQYPDFPASVTEIKIGLRKATEDVQGWLDNKRVAFPRLFFASDEDLLALVSNSGDMRTIQKQVPKYFAFSKLSLTKNSNHNTVITGFESEDGEQVTLDKHIAMNGLGVEQWLVRLESEMKSSLRSTLLTKYREVQEKWAGNQASMISSRLIDDTPGQVLQLILQIVRTDELEECVPTKYTHSLTDVAANCIDHVTEMVCSMKKLKKLSCSNAIKSLIATELYYRDWCQEMITNSTNNPKCLNWYRGMRYYLGDEDIPSVTVKQNLEVAHYGFEYLGSSPRLVWSQSIQTGFSAIWGAIQMNMGVVGYGPDSVGKSDIYRDFSRAVGKFSLFFNCNNEVTSLMLTRLLTGMAMTGCFLILTHFDSLDDTNMSLVLNAISKFRELISRKDNNQIIFMDRAIKLPSNVSLSCLTTISASSISRPEFSSIARSQMRFVAFHVPNIVSWTQSMLFVHGFGDAYKLGKHLGSLFVMASDHVSRQAHYDFTLRTLRIIIRVAEMHTIQGNIVTYM